MNCAVELVDVSKAFTGEGKKQVLAVEKVNLQIKEGEFFALLGPSGCGKTTVLRMIGGFETPSQGEIYIAGKVMTNRPAFQRPVNTVFQSYALFPHLTVKENIAFGLKIEKLPPRQIEVRVREMINLVKLPELTDRYPHQLSGGQQQRVALARALIKQPKVLLFDEPLGALDLKFKKEMQLELKHTQKQSGITFIYVTHDQEEALTMCDRMAVMKDGKILQVGSSQEIYEEPKNHFVAEFIGETNLLSGRIIEKREQKIVVLIEDKMPLTINYPKDDVAIGQIITVLIRPEKAVLYPVEYKLPGSLIGIIEDIIYLGTDTRYLVRISKKNQLIIRKQNLSRSVLGQFNTGENVKIQISPESMSILS